MITMIQIAIVETGNAVPNPIMRFKDGGFSELDPQFAAPTPVQSQGFALALPAKTWLTLLRLGLGLARLPPPLLHSHQHWCQ